MKKYKVVEFMSNTYEEYKDKLSFKKEKKKIDYKWLKKLHSRLTELRSGSKI